MATVENGMLGHIRGKIGNKVYFVKNGKQFVREISPNKQQPAEPTLAQLQARAAFSMVTTCLQDLRSILDIGFKPKTPAQKQKGAFGLAMAFNFNRIVSGSYPNLYIDYGKLYISHGHLDSGELLLAGIEDQGFRLDWALEPFTEYRHQDDQVLLLAYFPELNTAVHIVGNTRRECTQLLILPPELIKETMEVYTAFVSEDEKHCSTSKYLGTFNSKGR